MEGSRGDRWPESAGLMAAGAAAGVLTVGELRRADTVSVAWGP
ncbi:hypothetical protein [Streptomyces sp. NPDC026589]